ncbi:acetolactate synthase 2 catalytic subunit [Algicola sagamiensis]|uniref:acetolactate synthase 2 catalytic subunit n=1 Tax=Algicola sagamiensis TaxID=163869 RepID=UPI00036AC928|nr:acetolactate synthase 2 catalytic subunit [Algicola sagamiensis]
MTTGAQYTISILEQLGVDKVFGYPGGAIMPIYDAIYGSNLKHYLGRHEQGCAFSAIGYARASGKVGVCLATSGPGATNLITALADAMLDSIPVVAITGQVARDAMGSDAFQEVDVLGLALPVTKHAILVEEPEQLGPALFEAFHIAQSGRPGPVLVDIPKDIQVMEAKPTAYMQPQPAPCSAVDGDFAAANELITQSKKPIAYIGGGVQMAGAIHECREFVHRTGMPTVSTLKALGTISPDFPYQLNMLGMHGTPAANTLVQECDLLICIGARFDDRVTGKLAEFAPNAKVIHMDIDPAEVGKRRLADVALVGDLKASLPLLVAEPEITAWQQYALKKKASSPFRYDFPGETIYAPALLKELSDATPNDTVISCDVGQHQMWVAQHMSFHHPRNHLSSGGLGTMGFGLPAAIGAQLARPEHTVVTVSGDGSFMMNVQELTTIKRFQLPVKIVLIDNQRLGMVKQWQELFFEERFSETTLDDNPDFVALANAFEIDGEYIDSANQVSDAIARMLAHDGPYMLHVAIDEQANVWPLVPPGKANHQMLGESQP